MKKLLNTILTAGMVLTLGLSMMSVSASALETEATERIPAGEITVSDSIDMDSATTGSGESFTDSEDAAGETGSEDVTGSTESGNSAEDTEAGDNTGSTESGDSTEDTVIEDNTESTETSDSTEDTVIEDNTGNTEIGGSAEDTEAGVNTGSTGSDESIEETESGDNTESTESGDTVEGAEIEDNAEITAEAPEMDEVVEIADVQLPTAELPILPVAESATLTVRQVLVYGGEEYVECDTVEDLMVGDTVNTGDYIRGDLRVSYTGGAELVEITGDMTVSLYYEIA